MNFLYSSFVMENEHFKEKEGQISFGKHVSASLTGKLTTLNLQNWYPELIVIAPSAILEA